MSNNEQWFCNGVTLEIVNQFSYLGLVFTSGGSFMQATKTLSGKALRAMCSLLSVTRNTEVLLNIMLNLFDSFACSIFKLCK